MSRRVLFATIVTALLLTLLTIGSRYVHPVRAQPTTATSYPVTAAQARQTTSPLPTAVFESGSTPWFQVTYQPTIK